MSDTQCALGSGVPYALAPSQPTTYPQFLRKIGLVVSPSGGGQGLALLNPNIKIGTRVQIDNASINQTQLNSNLGFPSPFAPPSAPGDRA